MSSKGKTKPKVLPREPLGLETRGRFRIYNIAYKSAAVFLFGSSVFMALSIPYLLHKQSKFNMLKAQEEKEKLKKTMISDGSQIVLPKLEDERMVRT